MYKVLVTEKLSAEGLDILKEQNIEVDEKLDLTQEELAKCIINYDGLIVRSATKVDDTVLSQPNSKLRVVARAGVGIDNIDLRSASSHDIAVINAPTGNTIAASELTVTLILACLRNVHNACTSLKSGKWERSKFTGTQLYGKRVAVLGLGNIGRNVAERILAFGAKVVGYDPFLTQSTVGNPNIQYVATVDEAVKGADIVTVHTPLSEATRSMVSTLQLNSMNKGAVVVNCARGGIVDEDALYDALKSGQVAAAGLDVFVEEPATNNKLLTLDNVIATPHLGASTIEAQKLVAEIAAEQLANYLNGKPVNCAVNVPFAIELMNDEVKKYVTLSYLMCTILNHLSSSAGKIKSMRIRYVGEIFSTKYGVRGGVEPFALAGVKAFLESQLGDLSFIKTAFSIKERGIQLKEEHLSSHYGFVDNGIIIDVDTHDEEMSINGFVSDDELRVLEINGTMLDIKLDDENLIYLKNADVPGIVGKFGTILGDASININSFKLASVKDKDGSKKFAIGFISVDKLPSDETINLLKSQKGFVDVKSIKMNLDNII